ncbi:energy-coupling factor transporter transmembrane component T family protein [Paenibacillus sp. FSL K6-2524]|uniref:energy-coupling factor transporter transmembrane component T family protein n=1 Tax=Paenibacillus sp. FSL K6-2524 TaxID=2954516 RepID=UPI0030FA2551
MGNNSFLLYRKQNTWLEQWDPRMKITVSLIFAASLLLNHNLLLKTAQIVLLIILWWIAKLSWRALVFTLLSLTIFFISTMIYQSILITNPGDSMIQLGVLTYSLQGAINGILMCEQIAGIVLLLSLLVRTTSPIILAEGLEMILKPFKKLRFPVHEAVMMFTIALRFLPILIEEIDKIRKAQMARGGGFHRKGISSRFRGIFPMLMPLFVLSILRAKELAVAMESRCYQGDEGRTPIRLYRLHPRDYSILAFSVFNLLLIFIV